MEILKKNTLFEIFIVVQKFNFDFLVVLDFLPVDNFDFTRKIVIKNLGEKLVKMLFFVKIEFLDKNLTFRIV